MTLYWLRYKLSFSLLCSAITYLEGSRSSYHHFKFSDSAIDLVCSGSHLESSTWDLMTFNCRYLTFVVIFIIPANADIKTKMFGTTVCMEGSWYTVSPMGYLVSGKGKMVPIKM